MYEVQIAPARAMARFLIITATSGTNYDLAEMFSSAIAKGHDTEIIDLSEMNLPLFTVARSKIPEQTPDLSELIQTMTESDA